MGRLRFKISVAFHDGERTTYAHHSARWGFGSPQLWLANPDHSAYWLRGLALKQEKEITPEAPLVCSLLPALYCIHSLS